MCEINPTRKEFFRLEFFTSHELTDDEWTKELLPRLLELEMEFNSSGRIRVHIHEDIPTAKGGTDQ